MPSSFVPSLTAYPDITYAYSDRSMGNLSHARGDATTVQANRAQLARDMGVEPTDFLTIPHVGSNNVLVLTQDDILSKDQRDYYQDGGQIVCNCHRLTYRHADHMDGFDAVVTNQPGVVPLLVVGDCVGLQLVDTKHQAIGLVHAGLHGCVNDIVPCTLELMQKNFATAPSDLVAIVPPHIHACHYEVHASAVWQHQTVQAKHGANAAYYSDGRYDMRAVIGDQLAAFGLQAEQIHDVGLCTACNADRFFSNFMAGKRGQQKQEGRFASAIGIKRPSA